MISGKKYLLAVAALLTLPIIADAQDDINAILKRWNVITSGDLESVSHVNGAVYVGGDITVNGNLEVGNGKTLAGNEVSLAVAGDITSASEVHVNSGSAVVGGSVNSSTKILLNGSGSPTYTQNNSSALPTSPITAVTSASEYWSTLASNGSIGTSSSGSLVFDCSAGFSVAVFSISSADFQAANSQGFKLVWADSTTDVIINISGDSWNMDGNFLDGFRSSTTSHVIFNFYDATSVNLNGEVDGYVIAPHAIVTDNTDIYGGIMAEVLNTSAQVETRGSSWDGNVPNCTAVPEPSTWAAGVFTFSLLAFGLFRSRLFRKSVVK